MLHPVNCVSSPKVPPKLAILSITVYFAVSNFTSTSGVTKCKFMIINWFLCLFIAMSDRRKFVLPIFSAC